MKAMATLLLTAINFLFNSEIANNGDFESTLQQADFAGYVVYASTNLDKYILTVREGFKGDVEYLALLKTDVMTGINPGEEYLLVCDKALSDVTRVHYFLSKANAVPRSYITALENLPCNDASRKEKHERSICTRQYQPVCGCDNKTYGNPCEATKAGILKFKTGECL